MIGNQLKFIKLITVCVTTTHVVIKYKKEFNTTKNATMKLLWCTIIIFVQPLNSNI